MATTLSTRPTSRLHRFPGRSLTTAGRSLTTGAVQRLLARVGDRAACNLANINARLEVDRRATLRELRASRQRTVQAVEDERRRLERDLHDGAQQRLIALRIHLGLAAQRVAHEPRADPQMLKELAHEAQQALDDLRRLVHHSHPPLLERRGLAVVLRAAIAESPIHARLHAQDVGRYRPEIEGAVYFTCLEALQNTLKHAGPHSTLVICLYQRPGRLCFDISDTGPGFNPATMHHTRGGLVNMRDRIGALDGELSIVSTPARGTTIAGSVPLSGVPA